MMTIDEIRELIRVVQETGIRELEVRQGDSTVRIVGDAARPQEVVMPAVLPVALAAHPGAPSLPPSSPAPAPAPAPESASAASAAAANDGKAEVSVTSPIVGTYYDAPAPGTPPFVKVGDHVEPKQVLCIIESMKLMNEIEAEIAGTVVAKFVDNGRPVEYGEPLFTIRPL